MNEHTAPTHALVAGRPRRVAAIALAAALIVGSAALGAGIFGGSRGRSVASAATLIPHALGAGDVISMSSTKIKGSGGTGGTGNIELQSFSFGVSSTTTSTKSGLAAGKRQHSPISITREIDAASPRFFVAASAGASLGTVTIYVQPSSGVGGDSATIVLSNATVASDSWSGGVGDEVPSESITLTYQKIAIEYQVQQLST